MFLNVLGHEHVYFVLTASIIAAQTVRRHPVRRGDSALHRLLLAGLLGGLAHPPGPVQEDGRRLQRPEAHATNAEADRQGHVHSGGHSRDKTGGGMQIELVKNVNFFTFHLFIELHRPYDAKIWQKRILTIRFFG